MKRHPHATGRCLARLTSCRGIRHPKPAVAARRNRYLCNRSHALPVPDQEIAIPRLPEKESEAWSRLSSVRRAFGMPIRPFRFQQHPELHHAPPCLGNDPKRRHASARRCAMKFRHNGGWEKKERMMQPCSGRTALDQQDYDERRERLGGIGVDPARRAAKQLFSQAQAVKLYKQSVAAIEERPTAVTMA